MKREASRVERGKTLHSSLSSLFTLHSSLLLSLLMLTACITGPPPEYRDPTWTPTLTATFPVSNPTLSVTPGASSTAPSLTDTSQTPPPVETASSTPTLAMVLTPTSAPTPSPTPTRITAPHPGVYCYQVVPADNLTAISNALGVAPDILIDWNSERYPTLLTDPNHIEPDWVLCMPIDMLTNTPSPKRTP